METQKGRKQKTLTITLDDRDYAVIMKAARVFGLIQESLLMETGTRNEAGEESDVRFICDASRWSHPLAGACYHYIMFMQCGLLMAELKLRK